MSYDVNLGGGIGGFHSPSHDFSAGVPGLFIWAGWVDPLLSPGFSDAIAISHEIGEAFDDPTGRTRVPMWSFPTHPTECQPNLEVGDPIEVLRRAPHTVTIGGVAYHPQNLALLPWFSRQFPSPAFHNAYSFPNTELLTGPSLPCEREAGADGG